MANYGWKGKLHVAAELFFVDLKLRRELALEGFRMSAGLKLVWNCCTSKSLGLLGWQKIISAIPQSGKQRYIQ